MASHESEARYQYSFFTKYGKTIVAALYSLALILVPQLTGDGRWDRDEILVFAVSVGNVILVYYVPLNNSYKWVKTVVHFFLAALGVAQLQLVDGSLSGDDWMLVLAAGLSVIGVTWASAASLKQLQPVVVGKGFTTG